MKIDTICLIPIFFHHLHHQFTGALSLKSDQKMALFSHCSAVRCFLTSALATRTSLWLTRLKENKSYSMFIWNSPDINPPSFFYHPFFFKTTHFVCIFYTQIMRSAAETSSFTHPQHPHRSLRLPLVLLQGGGRLADSVQPVYC